MDSAARLTPDALLQHEAFVLGLARGLVQDDARARDVAQETWLTALEHPPRPGAVRAWLARVTRNHALNLQRGERRRSAREESTARPEAAQAQGSSQERLELQHGVVSAVLALDEPYRSVVIAVYYDGLAPSEVARRRRVAPGTVRSQLSRALDQLREKLDREHGERSAWSLALVGLLARRESVLAPAASAAAGLPWMVVWMGVVAVGLVVVVAWQIIATEPSRGSTAAGVAHADAGREVPTRGFQDVARTPERALRRAAASAGGRDEQEPHGLAAELAALLTRTRQVRALVLARRTEVDPDVGRAYGWIESLPDAGLARLVDRTVFEDRLDLPWLSGGGAFWSFSERTHDSARRPQLLLDQQGLAAPSLGAGKGVVIDLGQVDFRSLVLDPVATAVTFDEDVRAAWEVGHRELLVEHGMDRLELQQALRELRRDDEVEPEVGRSYLVRSFSPGEHDVLAVVEVARVEPEGCTLAWKLLESRPVTVARTVRAPDVDASALPETPSELLRLAEPALLSELERLRVRASALLLEGIPDDVLERFGALRQGPGGDIVRVLDATSPWVGLVEGGDGACQFSFATRAHGQGSEPDVRLDRGVYSMDFNVRSISWLLDLGKVTLEDAAAAAEAGSPAAWSLMSMAELPHFLAQAARIETQVDLQRRAADLGLTNSARGEVGHTYLLRSIFPGWHDHLVAFHLAHRDEAGDVLAWRVLRSWKVDRRR